MPTHARVMQHEFIKTRPARQQEKRNKLQPVMRQEYQWTGMGTGVPAAASGRGTSQSTTSVSWSSRWSQAPTAAPGGPAALPHPRPLACLPRR